MTLLHFFKVKEPEFNKISDPEIGLDSTIINHFFNELKPTLQILNTGLLTETPTVERDHMETSSKSLDGWFI